MTLLILIYGLIIGSFLNVCIYRMPREESIAFPASHCPTCGSSLKFYDLLPILSFLSTGGKCRYCASEISGQYPLVEILNALIYLLLFKKFGLSLDFLFYSIIFSTLIVVTFIDLKHMIIPDQLVLVIVGSTIIYKGLAYGLYGTSPEIVDSLLGMLFSGGLFILIIILSQGGMGGGDVTLIGSLGLILGVKYIFLTIFLSFILGAIISVFLLASKIKKKKDPIPFGPFIVLAFMITTFWGQELIDLYIKLLF